MFLDFIKQTMHLRPDIEAKLCQEVLGSCWPNQWLTLRGYPWSSVWVFVRGSLGLGSPGNLGLGNTGSLVLGSTDSLGLGSTGSLGLGSMGSSELCLSICSSAVSFVSIHYVLFCSPEHFSTEATVPLQLLFDDLKNPSKWLHDGSK